MTEATSGNSLVGDELRGWLLVLVMLFVASALHTGWAFLAGLHFILGNEWAHLTSEASAKQWRLYAVAECLWNALTFCLCCALLKMLLSRRRRFPKLSVLFFASNVLFSTADFWITEQISAIAATKVATPLMQWSLTILAFVIFAPLLLWSKYVRKVFVR